MAQKISRRDFLKITGLGATSLFLVSCGVSPTDTNPVADETPALILRSGFEADLTMYNVNDNILGLQGIDRSVSAPNDWAQASGDPNIGDFYFQLASPGTTADRSAFLTTDPVNPNNQVLAFQIKNATESGPPLKGRVSCNIGKNNNLHEIYYKVKLFLPADIGYLTDYTFPSGNWLNLMELWNSPDWTTPAPYPFRISLYVINSPDKQSLNFGVEAQSMDPNNWKRIWAAANTNFNLPFNEWLEMEVYYKEGNNSTGRFYMTATQSNGQKTVLFDVTNFTHHPENPSPTGLKFVNPMKLYCSKEIIDWISTHQPQNGSLQIYWDDFEFWKNKNPFDKTNTFAKSK